MINLFGPDFATPEFCLLFSSPVVIGEGIEKTEFRSQNSRVAETDPYPVGGCYEIGRMLAREITPENWATSCPEAEGGYTTQVSTLGFSHKFVRQEKHRSLVCINRLEAYATLRS
jgi:hypothetical protein